MQEATYHELAHIEHKTKARVYAKHGMHGKAESHKLRAAHHASFGMHTRSQGAPSDREMRALKRELQRMRDHKKEEKRREKKTSHAAQAVAQSARGVGQTALYSKQSSHEASARGPDRARDEQLPDESKEREAVYHLVEPDYDDAGADSFVDGDEELLARSRADAGKGRPHSAPPSTALAVTYNPKRVTCAITRQANGARKCRKRTKDDTQPESDQCLYEEGKGCVLNKERVFCVLSEKRRNTCRRARAGDIASDEDRMHCEPDAQNLCQYKSAESEEEGPASPRREHTLEEAGSYAMTRRQHHRAGSGKGQTRQCILQNGGPMQEGQRRRCVFAAAGQKATYLDEAACTLSESGKRCQLTQYLKGGGCMLSNSGRCKKAPRNYEPTDTDQLECKMYDDGKCRRTAYETQRDVRRSLPVAPLALISRPVGKAVNPDRRWDLFTDPDPQPLQASASGRKRLRGSTRQHDSEDEDDGGRGL
jgi:hypothetical protein